MGGSDKFYNRNVTDQKYRSAQTGVSSVAERELGRRKMDTALLPKGRRLICEAKSSLVYDFDVTGSMGNLPKIIWDKWPGIVGQVVARDYLPDAQMSITATGDIRSDESPLQMCDFSPLRNLDKWFKKIHFEGQGGGQGSESYEMTAYYYLNYCDMQGVELPIYLITGDEQAVTPLYADDLAEHFGGKHTNTDAFQVFAGLKKKFMGNVFRIHRKYTSDVVANKRVVSQWQELVGRDRVILLPEDLAIGDITLGLYAVVSGACTLSQYVKDMTTRPLNLGEDVKYKPQSPERVRMVEAALQPLKDFIPLKRTSSVAVSAAETSPAPIIEAKQKPWKL